MKDNFDCGCASVGDDLCLDDVYDEVENIRKFPIDCKTCPGYGDCEYCSLEDSQYCNECIYFEK